MNQVFTSPISVNAMLFSYCTGSSDDSLVPDGENFVVAASKLPSGGKVVDDDSVTGDTDHDKPVEEISYG